MADKSIAMLEEQFQDDPDFKDNVTPLLNIAPVNLDHILKIDGVPQQNLLNPWLPKAGLCMVYAASGVGKTFFCLNVAYAVAAGGNFLKFSAENPAKVLYIDGEMSYNAMQPRIKNVAKIQGDIIYPDNFLLLTCDQFPQMIMPKISTLAGQALFNRIIFDNKVDLVIADNISTLTDIEENSAEEWGRVQDWEIYLRSNGVSLILVHHTGKDKKTDRGTSKRRDILDTAILLEEINTGEKNIGSQFKISYTKARNFFGEDAESFEASLDRSGKWYMKTQAQSNFEKVVELSNLGMSQTDIAIELAINKSYVCKLYNKATEENLISIERINMKKTYKGRNWKLPD